MAGSSEQKAYVRGLAAQLQGNRALDAGAVRDGVVNNINHLADECAQHHGQLCVPVGAKPYFSQAAPSSTTYQLFDNIPPCPVFMSWLSDGSSSRFVVSLRGYCSGGGTATFRIVLRQFSEDGTTLGTPPAASTGATTIAEVSTASATGVDLGPSVLYVSAVDSSWQRPWPTYDSATRAASVLTWMGQIEVWAIATAGAPFIEAVRVRELAG